jgi:hypothetical protein
MRDGLSFMALLLSAVRLFPAQNLVDVPLDGLQLPEPLLLFVIGVVQAVFLGDKLLDLGLQRFSAGQLGKPLCLEIPGGGFGYDKIALVCLAVCGAGFLGFLRFQPLADGLGLGIGKYLLPQLPFPLQLRFQCFQFAAGLAHFLIGGSNGGFKLFRGRKVVLLVDGQGLGGLFQIVQLRPMGEACALLCLDIVLDINEQADLSVLPFRLAGRSGSSGNPGGKGFFGVVNPQRFQTGEPFLIRCSGRDILAALDLITFSLQAAKQVF